MFPPSNQRVAIDRCTYCAWWREPFFAGVLLSATVCLPSLAVAAGEPSSGGNQTNAAIPAPPERHFYIKEYAVSGGGHLLPKLEIEAAVYPYLGPYRTREDVEQARGALEQAYRDKGFQTVTVQIPPQQVKGGIIELRVMTGAVNRLRVHGSRYFSIDQIKREAPSLGEGQSPNFSAVTQDLLALNGLPDRQVTPTVRPGEVPGTVDVDLNVKDTLPVHGSLEINNRYSVDTTPLRLNASVSYDNLWQLEHSISASFQIAPENPRDVKVFSGYYLARIPGVEGISFMLQGTDQDSNVNTLGGIGVAGKGAIVGARVIFALPQQKGFYHSISLGLDYKHFTQLETAQDLAGDDQPGFSNVLRNTPVTYFPLSAAYSGTWIGQGYETDLNGSFNLAIRGTGSDEQDFYLDRTGADGGFIYFRGDLSHTRDLPEGFQIFAKAQGQAADGPLVDSEQFSGGGLGTVRGFLESEVLGDNALLGSIELRSPSLGTFLGKAVDEWRFYIFSDGGFLTQDDPQIETPYQYNLLSTGAGTRFKLVNHVNGSLDFGVPLIADSLESSVPAGAFVANPIRERPYEGQLTFRLWADF
ncbi:MAG TPA: ShlB/FhaC/HecB family hemolysin secretion/activation protein [Candidatus Methylacidiphilales bacterium]